MFLQKVVSVTYVQLVENMPIPERLSKRADSVFAVIPSI